jgi:uncharacterized protein
VAREVAMERGLEASVYVGHDIATVVPFGKDAESLRVVFQKGPARPLGEVSFLLSRLAGQALSRRRLMLAPELRDEVAKRLQMSASNIAAVPPT